jgi:hypothetical protein
VTGGAVRAGALAVLAAAALVVAPGARAQAITPGPPLRAGAGDPSRHPTLDIALLHLPGSGEGRARGVRSLLGAVARRTAVEVSSQGVPVVSPDDERLFDHPFVVLSGRRALEPLADGERDRIRQFVSLGGMILVDDQTGDPSSPFAVSARAELGRALGGRPFVKLPKEHAIYRSFYLLDRAWGRVEGSADLEAIVLGQRAAVVYSANDLLGAIERDELGHYAHSVDPGGSVQREMALRLGVNLVLYALTLDYKEDLVHLPLILERRR